MTMSYFIDKIETSDNCVASLTWNSNRTWSISKYKDDDYNIMRDVVTIRPEDFESMLKCKDVEFNAGMFGWPTIIKSSMVDGLLKLEEYTDMFGRGMVLGGHFEISVEDFTKLKEIAEKDRQTKPVHYCDFRKGEIVLDKESFA